MLDQQFGSIADCLHDNKNYKQLSGSFKELVMHRNISATISIVVTVQKLLAAEEAEPMSKLLALRFLKETIETASYCFLKLAETELLPLLVRIARHETHSKAPDRGKSLFGCRTARSTDKPENLEQLGQSLHILVLETLEVLARLLPESPYQYHEFPSMFLSAYRTLKDQGVTFPAEYAYYKPADQERISRALKEHDSAQRRTKEIASFMTHVIELARKEVALCSHGQYIKLLSRISSTGDSNFIQDYARLLEVSLGEAASHRQTAFLIRLINELFLTAEVETTVRLRDTFLLKLVGTAFLVDFEEKKLSQPLFEVPESKAIRRLCYEVLRLWESLVSRSQIISCSFLTGFCAGLPVPATYRLLNFEDCEIEYIRFKHRFEQNLRSHKVINESKRSFEETMPESREKLADALSYFRQLPINKQELANDILREADHESPAENIQQANIFVSRHQFFQSPATSKYVSDSAGFSAERVAAQATGSEVRVYFDASASSRKDLAEERPPSTSSKGSRSMQRVEVPCVQIQLDSSDNLNFFKKRQVNTRSAAEAKELRNDDAIEVANKSIPARNTNLEEESIILEPTLDPLDASYHENAELTENIMSKLRAEPVPSFKTATTVEKFMLPSKSYNEPVLRTSKNTLSQDMHVLRALNPTQRKHPSSQPSENQLKTALDQEVDKLTKMYTERVQQLERSLQESQQKERKYLRVIEEQRSEITSLRSEVSISARSRVSDPTQYLNEIEYLSNENKTLRNRLERFSNASELSKSARPSEGGGVNTGRAGRSYQTLEHPPVMLMREYDLKLRKPLLRNKELLFKNETVEIGAIACRDSFLRLTLFYTFSTKVREMASQLTVPEALEANYANLHISECSSNRQQKQTISFRTPTQFRLDQPKLTVRLTLDSPEVETVQLSLPVSISKFFEVLGKPLSDFKAIFREHKIHRYCSEEILYSKRILKEHRSVLQYFPKAVHLNPHREAEYNEGTKWMKYGWEARYCSPDLGEWTYLVKIYLNRSGLLFIEAVDLTNRQKSSELIRSYMEDLMALLVKQANR